MLRTHTSLLAATLLVAGCATGPGGLYGGQPGLGNTAKGAGLGALVGAGAGALFGGNRLENAGWGALAGGALGAAVGAYMDSQEQEMQQSLQGTGIQVQRTAENTLNLTMPSNVTFGLDSATLTPQAQSALDSVAQVLNHYPNSTINITGHTDDTGSDSHNLRLSEQRALSVAGYLGQHQVSHGRLFTKGMGESMPKFPNNNEANRAANRRVELAIIANEAAGAQQPGAQQQGARPPSPPQPPRFQPQQPPQNHWNTQQPGYPQQGGPYFR